MFRTEIDYLTGETITIPLTQEELAAIEANKPTLEQRNADIKTQRIVAFADLATGSDGMFIKAMATGEAKDLLAATERRQAIIDSLPYEVE
jgi:hypothetical protein